MITTTPRDEPASVDLAKVDLSDPELYSAGDPHAIWTVMRQNAPVYRHTLPNDRSFWSVTKYQDVKDVLRDHTRFTSSRGTLLSILGTTDAASGKMMAASDPPVHTAMREPMKRVFSHSAMNSRQPQIRRMVRKLLEPAMNGGTWDVAQAAFDFPMSFTGTLMGLPEEDFPHLARLTTMAIAPDDHEYQETETGTMSAAHHELFAYFSAQVKRRLRYGFEDDDLVGFLTQMQVNGRNLRHDEIVYNCYSLLLGANVTTPHAIASTLLALIETPGAYEQVAENHELIPSAIEEGLRWSSPTIHFLRHATKDMEMQGQEIAAGDAIVAWLGSANRDEDVFPEPFRFDIRRSPNRHVAFGFGPHHCIGAPLARIALRLFFEETVATVGSFEVAGPIEHLSSNFAAGIKKMPVTIRIREGAGRYLREALTSNA